VSNDRPSGKIPISLDDPETRRIWERAQVTAREVEQWPTWKRFPDEEQRSAARHDFQTRWKAFMEGGWERLLEKEPAAVEAVRLRVMRIIPQHPDSVGIAELVARMVDIEKVAGHEHLFAALLDSERHGHVILVAGHVMIPPPRVPRRGLLLEDMYYLFGYAPARER
jgi:hypothetical protein